MVFRVIYVPLYQQKLLSLSCKTPMISLKYYVFRNILFVFVSPAFHSYYNYDALTSPRNGQSLQTFLVFWIITQKHHFETFIIYSNKDPRGLVHHWLNCKDSTPHWYFDGREKHHKWNFASSKDSYSHKKWLIWVFFSQSNSSLNLVKNFKLRSDLFTSTFVRKTCKPKILLSAGLYQVLMGYQVRGHMLNMFLVVIEIRKYSFHLHAFKIMRLYLLFLSRAERRIYENLVKLYIMTEYMLSTTHF